MKTTLLLFVLGSSLAYSAEKKECKVADIDFYTGNVSGITTVNLELEDCLKYASQIAMNRGSRKSDAKNNGRFIVQHPELLFQVNVSVEYKQDLNLHELPIDNIENVKDAWETTRKL